MLEVKNIETVYFDRLYILKGLSLKVNKGEIRVVIGPNGAGKTTLLKSIMGLIKDQPRKGEIIFDGKNITRKDPEPRFGQTSRRRPSAQRLPLTASIHHPKA
jgi:branched-chain amino acid transport system ATP-binding protein